MRSTAALSYLSLYPYVINLSTETALCLWKGRWCYV